MIRTFRGIGAELIAAHPDTCHMIEDADVNAILSWMVRSLLADEWLDGGEVNTTEVAEWTIHECPDIDADDDDVWATDSGGVWDAAYCWSLWAEMETA